MLLYACERANQSHNLPMDMYQTAVMHDSTHSYYVPPKASLKIRSNLLNWFGYQPLA